ncbi:MAG: Ig-like domain-containing protein [Verrucomicrobiae bacterium]|nr:Ig-like domain-containing protein [Verrucomicrobiae bacterium]
MKATKLTLLVPLLLGMAFQFTPGRAQAQDIDNIAPVVVKTLPEAGSKDVPPGEYEVKITFSKEMADNSWSWSSAWQDSDPKSLGRPHYDADHKTCIMKVKLEPGKTYGWWINSQKFHGFQDPQHHPAIPYLLTFKTKDQ